METIFSVVVLIIIISLVLVYLNRDKLKESFGFSKFVQVENAEYKGINLLGVNSLDTHIATISESQCQDFCNKYTECDGYSYYKPGNRCYMFSKGGFVYNRPGFVSGMKM